MRHIEGSRLVQLRAFAIVGGDYYAGQHGCSVSSARDSRGLTQAPMQGTVIRYASAKIKCDAPVGLIVADVGIEAGWMNARKTGS